MTYTVRIVALLVVFVLASVSMAFAQDSAEGGDYFISGTRLDGSTYTGGMEIMRHATLPYYTLSWQVAEPFYGQGLLNGSILTAGWGINCVVAAFVADDSGNLTGQVVDSSAGAVNPQNAAIIESGAISRWNLTGTLTDGTPYEGVMTFTPNENGQSGAVELQVGAGILSGVALFDAGVFSVVYGNENCGLGTYVTQENGSLVGRWTLVGQTNVGTENATLIDISGAHNVTGTSLDGTPYEGTAAVTANNQVHTFDYGIGETVFPGVGILRGSTVAVGYGSETCSVASYFVYPNGMLSGLWSRVGSDTVGSETALRNEEAAIAEGALIPDVAGSYTIIGTNASDGGLYTGTLNVIPQGDVYQFSWTFENDVTDEGIGILFGNTITVASGGEGCAVNAYRVQPNSMEGVWAVYGQSVQGTENLSR